MRSIKQKIADLRQQPEAKRLRVVTLLTAGTGGILVVLWLAILLPLQIRLNTPNSEPATTQTALSPTTSPAPQQVALPRQSPRSGVAGVRTTSPAPQLPQATVFPSPSPSPSVTPVASPTPAETY